MKLSRPSRVITALIALINILFMQFAVAAYACPEIKTEQASDMVAMTAVDQQDMSGCTGTDKVQPSLCHAHDHAGNQSLDKPELPQVSAFMPVGLGLVVGFDEVFDTPQTRVSPIFHLTRATAPPLSIRHCCFRI